MKAKKSLSYSEKVVVFGLVTLLVLVLIFVPEEGRFKESIQKVSGTEYATAEIESISFEDGFCIQFKGLEPYCW